MPRELLLFAAAIPAGTPQTTPVTVPLTMPVRAVHSIRWRVPHGPSGAMGWQLAMGGVQVLPAPPTVWIIANDDRGIWEIDDLPDSGAWSVVGYNTGAFKHTVYLEFRVDLPTRPPKQRALLLPALLAPVPDLSQAGPPVVRPG